MYWGYGKLTLLTSYAYKNESIPVFTLLSNPCFYPSKHSFHGKSNTFAHFFSYFFASSEEEKEALLAYIFCYSLLA
jgi:hypothetical protein